MRIRDSAELLEQLRAQVERLDAEYERQRKEVEELKALMNAGDAKADAPKTARKSTRK